MTYTKFGTLVASVGVIAFALASHEASARPVARGGAATAHPLAHPFTSQAFRNRRGGIFLPGVSGDFYGSDGAPVTGVTPPTSSSSDVHYTYTYEVPWDWAHRNPPNVAPSDRPYVPGCTSEAVTVPGAKGGGEHLINVTRCY
jgi:hypothetical protein